MDRPRIISRISMFDHYVSNLKKITPKSISEYKKSESYTKAAVERYLQVLSELELDVIVLLHKGLELRPVGSEESVISAIEPTLGSKTVENVRARRRLRNALVHAYSDIDDFEVFKMASDLKDLENFKASVLKILK
ncbi:MAG: DUF86 domain-containing protein [Candidatus Micrarchaeota archaeon]|nr:DUF86 domain-containing protein [Candidatus Micrarchaeota archaeon]